MCGHACVYDNAKVYEYAKVSGYAVVCTHAEVSGAAQVYEYARVFRNAKVCGNAIVDGNAHISGDAVVESNKDYIVFKNFWSSGRHFTWTRSNNMWKVGCFYGTGEELIAKAYKDSDLCGRLYEYAVKSVNEMNKLLEEGE